MSIRTPSRRRRATAASTDMAAASPVDAGSQAAEAVAAEPPQVAVVAMVTDPAPAEPSGPLPPETAESRERAARPSRPELHDAGPPAWSSRFAGFAGLFLRRHASTALALMLALGAGALAGRLMPPSASPVAGNSGPALDELRGTLAALDARVQALAAAADVQALERRVVSLREGFDRSRTETSAQLSQLAARDPAASLAQVAAQLGRIEDSVREVGARLAAAEQRAALAPAVTGSIVPKPASAAQAATAPAATAASPATPAQADSGTTVQTKSTETRAAEGRTASLVAERPSISGWFVHDVRRGVALIEGPAGLMEIAKGQSIPGLGKVESIERRGRGWAVLTSRGTLEPAPW